MTIYHENLVGEQVHEPKGVAAASSGTHYFSDGAAGGTWTNIVATSSVSIGTVNEIEFTSLSDYSRILLEVHDTRVNLAGSERLDLVFGDSGGYKTSAGYYTYTSRLQTTEVAPASDTKIEPFHTDLTTGSYYFNGHIWINNFNEDRMSTFEAVGVYSSDTNISTDVYQTWTFGFATVAEDYDRLKLYTRNGGTVITGNSVRLFGWKG